MTDADAAPKEPARVPVTPSALDSGASAAPTKDVDVGTKASVPIVSDDDYSSEHEPQSCEGEEEMLEGSEWVDPEFEEEDVEDSSGGGEEESDDKSEGEEETELDAVALLAQSKRRMEEIAATVAAAAEKAEDEASSSGDDEEHDKVIEEAIDDESEADLKGLPNTEETDLETAKTPPESIESEDKEPTRDELIAPPIESDPAPVDPGGEKPASVCLESPPNAGDGEKDAASSVPPEAAVAVVEITKIESAEASDKISATAMVQQLPPRHPSGDAALLSQNQDADGGSDKKLRMNRDENADLYKLLAYSKRRLETGTVPGGRSSRRGSSGSKKEKRSGAKLLKNKEKTPERSARKMEEKVEQKPPVEGKREESHFGVENGAKENAEKSKNSEVVIDDGDSDEEKKEDLVDGEGNVEVVQKLEQELEANIGEENASDEEHESEDDASEYSSDGEDDDEDEDYSEEEDEEDEFEEFDLDDGLGGDNDVDAAVVEAARLKASTLLSLADAADVVASKATSPTSATAGSGPDQLQNLADSLTASMRDVGASVEKMKDKGASKMKDVEASVSGMKASMKASMRNVISPASPDASAVVAGVNSEGAEDVTIEQEKPRTLQDLQMKTMQKLQSLKQQEEKEKEVAASKNRRWFRPRRNQSNDDEPVFMDWSGTKMSVKALEDMQKKVKSPMAAKKGGLKRWGEHFVKTCNKVDSMYDAY